MAWPLTPRAMKFFLYVNNTWTDITTDVYTRDDVTITRGARDETSRPEPSSVRLTLNNRSGNYSPRNPTGIYFGSIGRNTPFYAALEYATDTFTRTVPSGWGTNDTGQTYTLNGGGGTVLASDLNVAGGLGTISVPAAGAFRNAQLSGVSLVDLDVTAQVSLPFTTITGAGVAFSVKLRDQGGVSYAYARLIINVGGSITIGIVDNSTPAFIAFDTTVAGLTHSSAQALRIRVQVEGNTFRAKVWAAAAGEPYAWNVTGNSSAFPGAGSISLQGWAFTGNTNTFPVVFSVDNFSVRIPRGSGEVANLPQRWDISGNDVYVPAEAYGVRRRLVQGNNPQLSTLRYALTHLATPPVAYWPCEEGKDAGEIASAVGGTSMYLTGNTDFAAYNNIASSDQLPVLGDGSWSGTVPPYLATGFIQLRFLLTVPSGSHTVFDPIVQMYTTGTIGYYEVNLGTIGTPQPLSLWVFDKEPARDGSGATQFLNLQLSSVIASDKQMVSLELTQSGGNVIFAYNALKVGETQTATGSFALGAGTIGVPTRIVVNPLGVMNGATVGHINVRKEITALNELAAQTNANTGENTIARMIRLAGLAGVNFDYIGTPAATQLIGSQKVDTLANLLDQAADTDLGTLFEPRGVIGLVYRAHRTMTNQSAMLDLNYAAQHVSPPLEPTDDDQLTRNDVTVTRQDGSYARDELVTGRLSTKDPALGGVGRYVTGYTVNAATDLQLPDLAGQLLAQGTVNEARYPVVVVDLSNQNVLNSGLETAALGVDVGDRITISNPKTGQTPDQISLIVRGYTEVISDFKHLIEFNCAPESVYQTGIFDLSPTPCKLGSGSSTLAAGATSGATSLSVATSAADITWKTGAVSIPIEVAGERMTVTNISGVSSPQTFTVTRSANGVVKAQVAGSAVVLQRSYRTVLGL